MLFTFHHDFGAVVADYPAACEVAPAEEYSVLGGLVAGPAPAGLNSLPENMVIRSEFHKGREVGSS